MPNLVELDNKNFHNPKYVFDGNVSSYKVIRTKIIRFFSFLQQENLLSKDKIAIYGDCTEDYLACIITAYLLGITFVPLSRETPIERIRYILNEIQEDFVINTTNDFLNLDIIKIYNNIFYNKINDQIYRSKRTSIMYIIYTSGSSGTPKGVQISYNSFENFVKGLPECFNICNKTRFLFHSSIMFDISLLESIIAILYGSEIVAISSKFKKNYRRISADIMKYNVNTVFFTPSQLYLLRMFDKSLSFLKQCDYVLIGGENPEEELVNCLLKNHSYKLINLYGPTESTIFTHFSELKGDIIDISNKMPGINYFLEKKDVSRVNKNYCYEIVIEGNQLYSGYVHEGKKNISQYRTGDLVQICEGKMIFYGRIDNQIKLNGNRIEIEEIEISIIKTGLVERCTVIVKNSSLIAYYVNDREIEREEIINCLKNKLPDYMVPRKYIKVKDLPLSTNGKKRRLFEDKSIQKDIVL